MAMFKDKALKVTVIPKEDTEPTEQVVVSGDNDTIEKIGETTKEVVQAVGSLMLLYIAADTARKVIVELAKK